jgi:hypothetical protein
MLGISTCFGQRREKLLSDISEWSYGTLTLSNDQELTGYIKLDEITHQVSFKSNPDKEPVSFTSKTASHIRFDNGRDFHVFSFDVGSNMKRNIFCEILGDYKTFLIISRKDPVDLLDVKGKYHQGFNPGYGSAGYVSTRTVYRQTEVIYFVNNEDVFEPYLLFVKTDIEGLLTDEAWDRNKVLDKKVFPKYAGAHWSKMESYIEENHLKIKRKDDFLKLLDLYDELIYSLD